MLFGCRASPTPTLDVYELNKQDEDGNTELMRLIIISGTGTNIISNVNDKAKNMINTGMDLNIQNKKGETALTLAILHKHSYIEEILLESNTDINIPDKTGNTPFMYLLLKNTHLYHDTSLHVKYLLDNKSGDVNTINNVGKTPLLLCNPRYWWQLIRAGANPNFQNQYGWTPFMIVCRNIRFDSTVEFIKDMIKKGADLNLQNKDGWTALMLATRYANVNPDKTDIRNEIVQELINAGADLNIQNNHGWTALMLASRYSSTWSTEKCMHALLDAGADVTLVDHLGRTAHEHHTEFLKSNTGEGSTSDYID